MDDFEIVPCKFINPLVDLAHVLFVIEALIAPVDHASHHRLRKRRNVVHDESVAKLSSKLATAQ